ncbi:sporulation membrane protein YtaF [Thermodesulfitimonas sp.]
MDAFGALLLLLAANLDNLGVGMALGTRKIRVALASNLLVALVTSVGTALSLVAGRWLTKFLAPTTAQGIGAVIIAAMGMWICYQEIIRVYRKGREKAEERGGEACQPTGRGVGRLKEVLDKPLLADTDYSGHIDVKEACLLGVALALNNFVAGAGVCRLDVVLACVTVFIFSLLFLWLGIKLGQKCLSQWVGEKAGLAGGLLLVAVGIAAFFF